MPNACNSRTLSDLSPQCHKRGPCNSVNYLGDSRQLMMMMMMMMMKLS